MLRSQDTIKLIFLLFFQLSTLFAEDNLIKSDSSLTTYYLNPIVKTATKIAGTQRDLSASISLISGPKLKNSPTSQVFELIQNQVPGFFVTEWGVMGFGVAGSSAGKISIRGLGGTADTHILILRNGRPDFMGLMGCTIGDEFTIDGVERIEVVRGPASFLYGTNATAGVINIVSSKITEKKFETQFHGSYGTYNTQKLAISHGGKIDRFDYLLTLASRTTDGHRIDGNGSYSGKHYTLHTGYQANPNTSVELNGSVADLNLYDPGPTYAPQNQAWYDIQRWGGDFTINHLSQIGETNLKIHTNFGKHRFFDGWFSEDQMFGIMAYHNIKPSRLNTTTIGIDLKQYGGHGENGSTGQTHVPFQKHYITEVGPYVHTQQILFQKLIGSVGLRLEHHDKFGLEWLPKLGLVTHISQTTSWRMTLSKGLRNPSIRELYFFPSHNANLKPDAFWNYEIGIHHRIAQNMKLDGTLFHIHGENLIILSKRTQGPGFQLNNSGEIENTGYELMFNWLVKQNFNLDISWSHITMKFPIPNAPEKKLTLYGSYQYNRILFSGTMTWIMDRIGQDNDKPVANVYPMNDYILINFTLSAPIYGPLGIKMSMKNGLDTEYQAMYGYPMPGRHLVLDLTYQF